MAWTTRIPSIHQKNQPRNTSLLSKRDPACRSKIRRCTPATCLRPSNNNRLLRIKITLHNNRGAADILCHHKPVSRNNIRIKRKGLLESSIGGSQYTKEGLASLHTIDTRHIIQRVPFQSPLVSRGSQPISTLLVRLVFGVFIRDSPFRSSCARVYSTDPLTTYLFSFSLAALLPKPLTTCVNNEIIFPSWGIHSERIWKATLCSLEAASWM